MEAVVHPRGRVGVTPVNSLNWEDPPKRGTFFRLLVYEKVGISLVEEKWKGRKICQKDQNKPL